MKDLSAAFKVETRGGAAVGELLEEDEKEDGRDELGEEDQVEACGLRSRLALKTGLVEDEEERSEEECCDEEEDCCEECF